MTILDTLLPLVLLIGLGAALARVGFLGRSFMADLNQFAFWIALPALLFESADSAAPGDRRLMPLLGVLLGGTALVALLAAAAGRLLGLSISSRGTLARAQGGSDVGSLPKALRAIATNPLLIAGGLGIALPALGVVPPQFISRTLAMLAAAAIPAALLCIGGSLATTSLKGSRVPIFVAAAFKIAVLPAVVYALARLADLGPGDLRSAVVFAACPTAAASFVMARQMGGDEPLASGAIAVSTALSAASVAMALAVTGR